MRSVEHTCVCVKAALAAAISAALEPIAGLTSTVACVAVGAWAAMLQRFSHNRSRIECGVQHV